LPGIPLPDPLLVTSDLHKALEGASLLILAIPCQAARSVLALVREHLGTPLPVIGATKGIEKKNLALVSEIMAGSYSPDPADYAILSGPSFAREVVKQMPTAVVTASRDSHLALDVQRLFNSPWFKVYTRRDVRGIEVAGAMKNVLALAAGISDGMGLGDNARAALITRGLAEMTRLGLRMGADPLTFSGLAGVGDLLLTAMGDKSRNRTVGFRLGQGAALSNILTYLGQVADGVPTTQSAHELSIRYKVDLPITDAVYRILYENADLKKTLVELMSRPLRSEEESSG
jgi:glycerol-3-phosphate dehydrogenase (NAD(P)+)